MIEPSHFHSVPALLPAEQTISTRPQASFLNDAVPAHPQRHPPGGHCRAAHPRRPGRRRWSVVLVPDLPVGRARSALLSAAPKRGDADCGLLLPPDRKRRQQHRRPREDQSTSQPRGASNQADAILRFCCDLGCAGASVRRGAGLSRVAPNRIGLRFRRRRPELEPPPHRRFGNAREPQATLQRSGGERAVRRPSRILPRRTGAAFRSERTSRAPRGAAMGFEWTAARRALTRSSWRGFGC